MIGNTHSPARRQLNSSGWAMVAARMKKCEAELAKERQKVRKGNQPGTSVANLPHLETGKARDKAGARFKVSGKSVDSAARAAVHLPDARIDNGNRRAFTPERPYRPPGASEAAVKIGKTVTYPQRTKWPFFSQLRPNRPENLEPNPKHPPKKRLRPGLTCPGRRGKLRVNKVPRYALEL